MFTRGDLQAIDAEHVFSMLGPAAKPAIPELVRLAITAKGETRVGRCARTLAEIGPEALPAFADIVGNPKTIDRGYVIEQASHLDGLSVPLMLKTLSDPDPNAAAWAATCLGFMHLSNSTVIPALVAMLQGTNAMVRCSAQGALARFGPDARPAIPALMQTLSDPETNVRLEAVIALHHIEPETFTNMPPGMSAW